MNKTLLNEYWNKYKAEFGTDNFKKNELYKWSLFKQMYPIWKWKKGESNIEMYENTFNVDGHKNLWLSGNFFPIGMLNLMLKNFPEETENAMILLLDESKELSNRIDSFTAILDNKLPELAKLIIEKPINQHYHGDLRAISIYLTLQYPEKYFLYKHTMYKTFSEILEMPKVKTGKTSNYTEYLDVCNGIREFIRSDKGFMTNYKDFLSGENFYEDPYLHLLVQDFILSVSTYEPSYWIFQGNPKVYDFSSAINEGTIDQWTASAHRDKMRIGDRVVFWLTGTNSGCYALGEITSDPFKNFEPKDEFWKEEDKSEWKVGVKISHNCSSNPILKEQADTTEELVSLNVGNQGTNFTATKEQYECIEDIVKSSYSDAYTKIKKQLAKDKMEVFLSILRNFVKENILIESDPRISFNIRESKNRLVFLIGKRYTLCIEKIKNETVLSFISPNNYNGDKNKSFTNSKGESEAFWNFYDDSQADQMLKYINDGLTKELSRNHICNFKSHSNSEFAKDILGESNINYNNVKLTNIAMSQIPLNQILYGPPGTGKTYNTINKALDILEVDTYNMKRADIVKLFKLKVLEGQIVFTTFHQSFSYEDFIEGIKPVVDSNESTIEGDLKYTVENGVFKDLVERIDNAQQFLESAQKEIYIDPLKFSKNVNKISLGNSQDSKDDVIYEYCMNNDCIVIGFGEDIDFTGVKNRIEIRKRFQDNGIETTTSMDFNISAIERFVLWMELGELVFVSDGMSKLKAIGEVTGDYYCDPSSPIRFAQFRKVKWLYKDLALPIEEIYGKKFSQQTIYQIDQKQINQSFFSAKNPKKKGTDKYVLIIDEINRGNISAIFGELITLIEPDKRKGEAEELSAILPYSKTPFSVPKNLYIIGTMNTADRSVEALDTALRRRFSFEEMLPKPELLKDKGENGSGKVGEINLEELLKTINERIEALVDRDHTIGHAFFMEVDSLDSLRNVFANKVIPLLQEYFYGDYAKMEMVIGSDFFNIKDSSKIKFAVKPEDFETTGKTYQIKNLSDKTSMADDVLETAFKNMISVAN